MLVPGPRAARTERPSGPFQTAWRCWTLIRQRPLTVCWIPNGRHGVMHRLYMHMGYLDKDALQIGIPHGGECECALAHPRRSVNQQSFWRRRQIAIGLLHGFQKQSLHVYACQKIDSVSASTYTCIFWMIGSSPNRSANATDGTGVPTSIKLVGTIWGHVDKSASTESVLW